MTTADSIKLAIELANLIQQGPRGIAGLDGEDGKPGKDGQKGKDGRDGEGIKGDKGEPGMAPAEVDRLVSAIGHLAERLDALEGRKVHLKLIRDKQGRITGLVEQ